MTSSEELITDPLLLSVLQSAEKTRLQGLAIADLIARQHASADADSEASQLESSKQHKLLNAHLAQLRGLYRKATAGVRITKQETAEAKTEVDNLHLQHSNLKYEEQHLHGSIAAKRNYQHTYENIGMIPTEEFLELHPELVEANEHDVTEARIRDEHAQRKALEEERQLLLKRKEALVKVMTARKEELAKVDGEMEKWVAGQEGVRKLFEAREKKLLEQAG